MAIPHEEPLPSLWKTVVYPQAGLIGGSGEHKAVIIGRFIGWLFLAMALLAGSAEIALSLRAKAFTSLPLGQFWADLSEQSLERAQAWASNTSPWVADPGLTTILQLPAWPFLLGVACVLLWLFRQHVPPAPYRPQVIGASARPRRA